MKLILSRKGFDSGAGGVPSPIFPDGRMVSLPIPDKTSRIRYSDLGFDGQSLGPLVAELTHGKVRADYKAHLDPDLSTANFPRLPGWRALFGQTGPAQGHLRNHGVGAGDLFLFFGLFRRVEKRQGRWAWVKGAPPRHVIWGWMQVGELLDLGAGIPSGFEWAHYHPHFGRKGDRNNVVYVAKGGFDAGRGGKNLPGAGVFQRLDAGLQLTSLDARGTTPWVLPSWFYPYPNRRPLSYHSKPERWEKHESHAVLHVVKRGQEFVLDCDEYPEALPWARNLIAGSSTED